VKSADFHGALFRQLRAPLKRGCHRMPYSMLMDHEHYPMITKIRERFTKRYTRPLIVLRDLLWLPPLLSMLIWEWTFQIRKLFGSFN
jgi:hypothetical protein